MSHANRKICFIVGTLGQGGAERQLYYYLKTLKSMGITVFVLCFTQGEFWEQPIQELGIPIYWVGKHKSRLLRLITILNHIRKLRVDFIQSQHFHTNLYAVISARIMGVKGIGGLRSDVYREVNALGKLGKPSLSWPSTIVANSKNAIRKAILLGISENHLFYLPNFVDDSHFRPQETSAGHDNMIVAFIGTLWPPKRVDRVIYLAKECKDNGLNIKFMIYGDGILMGELRVLAKELGVLETNTEFKGRVIDAKSVYQSSDLLLLTSDHEGTPNVVLEAMACGIPVISSNVGDVSEIIKDEENGYLFAPSDLETAFIKIVKLYKDPILRCSMGKAGRDFILEHRSLKNIQEYFIELYMI